jgi:hypothetical protein
VVFVLLMTKPYPTIIPGLRSPYELFA